MSILGKDVCANIMKKEEITHREIISTMELSTVVFKVKISKAFFTNTRRGGDGGGGCKIKILIEQCFTTRLLFYTVTKEKIVSHAGCFN